MGEIFQYQKSDNSNLLNIYLLQEQVLGISGEYPFVSYCSRKLKKHYILLEG
jgi:hypothetical protein